MKKDRVHLYEGMYVISAGLSEDARKKALDRIVNGITSRGGEVKITHEWGRRRLAYEVAGHREGYYYILYFEVPTWAINEMWQEYHLNEDLVRFMTTRAEEVRETIEFKPLVEAQ